MNLSSEPEVLSVIQSDSFIRQVRRASITLRDTGLVSNEDIIEAAKSDAYPRVSLIIASTKTSLANDAGAALGGVGPTIDYSSQYREIKRLMIDSPYAEGIHRVAAALTASICIKQVPLNSDIQLFDLGKQLEDQALADLDRIIGVVNIMGVPSSGTNTGALSTTAIYLSSSIDMATIPVNAFDKVKGSSAAINGVKTNESINVEDEVGVCWIYITGTLTNQEVSTGFLINESYTIEDILESAALSINDACISRSSSILCSPNRGELSRYSLAYKKHELYRVLPDDPNSDKELSFTISTRIHRLELTSRTLSTTINRELISIKLYKLPIELAPDLSTALSNRYSDLATPIEGVVYGTTYNYYALDNKGPHSLLIDVEKQSASADLSQQKDQVDTFYFQLEKDYKPEDIQGVLSVRIASPPNGEYTTWSIDVSNSSAEEVAFHLLSSMYERHLVSQLLGAMPQSNAVQVVPYIRVREEVRMVMDITELPLGLSIATGTSLSILTQYKPIPRSVMVKLVPDQTLDKDDINSGPYAATSSSPVNKGPRLQSVYDRIDLLRSLSSKPRYTL